MVACGTPARSRSGHSQRVVICGPGVVGTVIIRYAAKSGAPPVVIGRHVVGASAVREPGAFLALDWCLGSDLDQLARGSFGRQNALCVDRRWTWRRAGSFLGYHSGVISEGKP